MTLLQQGTPDTLGFMLLGLGAILSLMGLYVAFLLLRWRSGRQELELLEDIQQEGSGESDDHPDARAG